MQEQSLRTGRTIAVNSVLEAKPQATTVVKCAALWLVSIFAVPELCQMMSNRAARPMASNASDTTLAIDLSLTES